MEELFKHAAGLSDVVLTLGIVCVFTLQLLRFLDVKREKEQTKQTVDANQGINHLSIFEKLGEHHGVLLQVKDDVEGVRDAVRKLENDFRLHTQSDTDIANRFIRKLDRLDEKLDVLEDRLPRQPRQGS